jgi:hypothetical protein
MTLRLCSAVQQKKIQERIELATGDALLLSAGRIAVAVFNPVFTFR